MKNDPSRDVRNLLVNIEFPEPKYFASELKSPSSPTKIIRKHFLID